MVDALPTVVISPFDVRPPARRFRDMPINELGAADFAALLRTSEDEQRSEAVKGILRDIASGRVVYPIVVRLDPDAPAGRYQLVSGWLVWSAAVYLRKDSVRALIWEADDAEPAALTYRLNHHRLPMKRSESARIAGLVAALLAGGSEEVTYRDVAKALSCSPSWAFKLLHENGAATAPPPELGRPRSRRSNGVEGRPRGRPPVSVIFSFDLSDPRRWESSVRLRAVMQGKAPHQQLKLQRSEEFEGWRDISTDDFLGALSLEVERLRDWLTLMEEKADRFFPGKNGHASRCRSPVVL